MKFKKKEYNVQSTSAKAVIHEWTTAANQKMKMQGTMLLL